MKLFNNAFMTAALALCLYIPFALASSDEDKITGFYISRTPYQATSVGSPVVVTNEQALIFRHDGTLTRSDASAYDQWGRQGSGNQGLLFDPPNNGVWEIVKKTSKKIKVHAVMFQYAPLGDYPPLTSGLPGFFAANSQSIIVRRCWEFEFSHLKDGKFQKCTGIKAASIAIKPNQDPLSTDIAQEPVQPASPGPLPVFSRVNVEKTWFKGF